MRALLVLLVLAVSWAGSAHADVHTSKAGKASIDIPKKWSVTATDELVRAVSPDSKVALVFWVTDSTDTKAALTKLEGELYSSVQGLKWVDKTKKLKIGKLPATWVEGAGLTATAKQLVFLVVVDGPTPGKKGIIMFAAVEHDNLAAMKPAIQSVFQSLRPTK